MLNMARTIGMSIIGALAVPIAGISGLASLVAILGFVFMQKQRNSATFMFAVCAAVVCYLAIRQLKNMAKKADQQVATINAKENLQLNPDNMLGYPSPAFLVFDKQNRKLAVCNSTTQEYKIFDFTYVMEWRYEWRIGEKTNFSGGGDMVPGTNMRGPVLHTQQYKTGFTLILEVADEYHPILKFPMGSEGRAQAWCAKLNAILMG